MYSNLPAAPNRTPLPTVHADHGVKRHRDRRAIYRLHGWYVNRGRILCSCDSTRMCAVKDVAWDTQAAVAWPGHGQIDTGHESVQQHGKQTETGRLERERDREIERGIIHFGRLKLRLVIGIMCNMWRMIVQTVGYSNSPSVPRRRHHFMHRLKGG